MSIRSPQFRRGLPLVLAIVLLATLAGCAKFNTFYNAKRAFDKAEDMREERLKAGEDVTRPTGQQQTEYSLAIRKSQKILDEYPGSGMTDDALFLMGKSYFRINSYRMSIRKFELLFTNYPVTDYEEEAVYLQAMNYLLIGDVGTSRELLTRLENKFPGSEYQSEALSVGADNAFVLEDWEAAATGYRRFLDEFPHADQRERDRVSYQLGLCHWELGMNEDGVERLLDLIETETSIEFAFRGKLLLSRVYTRLERFDESAQLLETIRSEAETWNAQGDVLVAEAENLIAMGEVDEAAPLLENIPAEWATGAVKPRISELIGDIHFMRWELVEARNAYKIAVNGALQLDEPELVKARYEVLREYLAAGERLGAASDKEIPKLKLKQANSLLFGLNRPRMALDSYLAVLESELPDSTTVPRACFGAALVYRDYLDEPDSAAIYEDRLLTEFPQTAQAYQVRTADQGDLLAYLLERQSLEQEERRLAIATADSAGLDTGTLLAAGSLPGVDRVAAEYEGNPRWQPRQSRPIRPAGRRS